MQLVSVQAVSGDLSSLSVPSIPLKGHSSHMFMSPSVSLCHYPGVSTWAGIIMLYSS